MGRHDRRGAHVLPRLLVDDDLPRPGPVRDRDLLQPVRRRDQRPRRPARPEGVTPMMEGRQTPMARVRDVDPRPHLALVTQALTQDGQPRALFAALDRAMEATL